MTVVDLNIDAEILSSNESTPKAPKAPPANPASSQCHFCPEEFEGPARFFTRGRHEKANHKAEWEASKVPGAKKATKVRKATAKKAPVTKTKVTSPNAKRIPAAESIARNIGRIAKVMGGVDMPMAKALAFSAPATGQAVDELVAGTYVDKMIVQRFAGVSDKWERLGGVIAFPILVAVISKNPALFPVLEDELREATLDVVIANIPSLEKQKARENKAVAALARLGQIDERFANTNDPIGLILQDLFGPRLEPEGDGHTN